MYFENQYGIRIENLMLVKEAGNGFLEFQTLTLAPIDHNLIDFTMLDDREKKWLKNYHLEVYKKLNFIIILHIYRILIYFILLQLFQLLHYMLILILQFVHSFMYALYEGGFLG